MAYLEELLPEFRKGAKIREWNWDKGHYIYLRNGKIYDECNEALPYSLNGCSDWFLSNKWEIYNDPKPDWQYIIDNKCLCWFWDNCDKEGWRRARFLSDFIPNKTTPFLDEAGCFWPYCRPVRRSEITFYEDKEDDNC